MLNIHDSGYKRLFSNKVIFRQLIETFVKEDWVKELDFATCEIVNKTFISELYQKTESDLIYKLKWKGCIYFYFNGISIPGGTIHGTADCELHHQFLYGLPYFK